MKKIIIVGKGASGKNFLMERFESREYHFISNEEFERMIKDNELFEYQKFGDYYYGTSNKEWNMSDVAIMAPQGVKNLNRLGIIIV